MNENSYPKNKIELPTVGRIVLVTHPSALKPLAAIVTDTNLGGNPLTINVGAWNQDGTCGPVRDLAHVSEKGNCLQYWDWMPYQKSQAAKTEQLQRELEDTQQANETARIAGMLKNSKP